MTTEDETVRKDKHKIYGKIKMHDGSAYRGFVYAKEGERLQDMLNDDRQFIPIQLVNDLPPYNKIIGTVILSKRYIITIEEIEYNPLFL